MHFKLRVLDLLDVMARKQPPSPLLLLLPRPLLDAMAQNSARPEQRALLDRCSSLLRHRLCKLHLSKADPWDAKALPPASLLAEMQQVLHPPLPLPHTLPQTLSRIPDECLSACSRMQLTTTQ